MTTALLVLRVVGSDKPRLAKKIRITRLDDALSDLPAAVRVEPLTEDDLVDYVRDWYRAIDC